MPRLLFASIAAVLASASIVSARPSTLSMTCAQAAAAVASGGSLLLSTSEYTYDRFVAGTRFCMPGERAQAATAPTLDTPSCRLGYTCKRAAPKQSDDF